MSLLVDFSNWLAGSPLPSLVTGHDWLVPAIQVLHILAVAAVVLASAHIHLRTLGVLESDVAIDDVARRFLPLLWGALGVLAFTGILLIASEPIRAIFRAVFWVKLALATAASLATWAQRPLALNAGGSASVAGGQKALAVAAMIFWVLTIYAGRWIAYADPWAGAPS